jgi:hypothetical protein
MTMTTASLLDASSVGRRRAEPRSISQPWTSMGPPSWTPMPARPASRDGLVSASTARSRPGRRRATSLSGDAAWAGWCCWSPVRLSADGSTPQCRGSGNGRASGSPRSRRTWSRSPAWWRVKAAPAPLSAARSGIRTSIRGHPAPRDCQGSAVSGRGATRNRTFDPTSSGCAPSPCPRWSAEAASQLSNRDAAIAFSAYRPGHIRATAPGLRGRLRATGATRQTSTAAPAGAPCTVPKLTTRVRSPSPAPGAPLNGT